MKYILFHIFNILSYNDIIDIENLKNHIDAYVKIIYKRVLN